MKNYEAPELISAGSISEVVLGPKAAGQIESLEILSFPTTSVLDID